MVLVVLFYRANWTNYQCDLCDLSTLRMLDADVSREGGLRVTVEEDCALLSAIIIANVVDRYFTAGVLTFADLFMVWNR